MRTRKKVFGLFLVCFRNNSYLCTIARSCLGKRPQVERAQQWAAGGLSDQKDVFERLSL